MHLYEQYKYIDSNIISSVYLVIKDPFLNYGSFNLCD